MYFSRADHAVEGSPPPVELARERLEVGRRLLRALARRRREQAAAGEPLGHRQGERVEDGRQDVDVPGRRGDDPRPQDPRLVEDEGDPERRLVGEDPVRRLSVLAQRLTVVRGQDDQRPGARPVREEGLQEAPERSVGRRHLALVGLAPELRRQRLGGLVGEVGLVEVDPAEPRRVPGRVDEAAREADRLDPGALLLEEHGPRRGVHEAVLVDVEALPETEPRIEGKGAHEGPGAVPVGPQQGGEGRGPFRKAEAGVVPDTVVRREASREDVRVGGQGGHVVGVRAVEADPLRREPVHPGCGRAGAAVRAEGVGPQRVHGDEEDARPAWRRCGARRPSQTAAASRATARMTPNARRTRWGAFFGGGASARFRSVLARVRVNPPILAATLHAQRPAAGRLGVSLDVLGRSIHLRVNRKTCEESTYDL